VKAKVLLVKAGIATILAAILCDAKAGQNIWVSCGSNTWAMKAGRLIDQSRRLLLFLSSSIKGQKRCFVVFLDVVRSF
jgi:hypothetical protein